MLLDHNSIDVNIANCYGETPLISCVRKNNHEMVELLFSKSKVLDVNKKNKNNGNRYIINVFQANTLRFF